MFIDSFFNRFVLPEDLKEAVSRCKWRCYPETRDQLLELCFGPTHSSRYDVTYNVPGKGIVKEAEVVRCKNGPVVNFMEDYMRRRDPDCMRIGDGLPTDKPRFKDVYGYDFKDLRKETMDWLAAQDGWFLRMDGDNYYGNSPMYERISIHPKEPLEFFNMDGTPGAT